MLTVWGRRSAYNVQKVLWFMDELALDYQHIDVGSNAGDLESESFQKINPHGRVPVIQDNEHVIWESNTIIRYLASVYGQKFYGVDEPYQRSLVERWMDWELATLQVDFLALFWKYYRTPVEDHDKDAISLAHNRCIRDLSILDKQLKNYNYVAGSEFSVADICVGTSFYRLYNMGVELPRLSNVVSWYKKLSDRPAYQNNIMMPFEGLKGRLVY